MGWLLRRLFFLAALAAFGWAAWLYVEQNGVPGLTADDAAAPEPAAVEAGGPRSALDAVLPQSVEAPGAPRTFTSSGAPAERRAARNVAGALEEADIAYNRPDTMRLNQPTNILLVMDASGEADLAERLRGYVGDLVETSVGVGHEVEARLNGPGFEITSRSPERQALSLETQNTWEWQVRALQEGERELTLTIYAYVGGAAEVIETYSDTITIEVTTIDRVIGLAQTAHPVVGVVAGAVSLLVAFFGFARRRRERR